MAMCLSLAAFNPLAGAAPAVPVRILEPACVAKTFPDYFEALFGLAGAVAGAVPVIAVDGPSASGKGTLASRLAAALGYHLLDSGAIYRAAGVAAHLAGVDLTDGEAVAAVCRQLDLRFDGERVLIDGADRTDEVRSEAGGLLASQVSAHPAVRQALHDLQLSFRRLPGLVADGRDMGTVVFPDAALKVFLTASAARRADRRHKQLISKGIQARLQDLRADLERRDEQDRVRSASPLKPAEDALALDNSEMGIDESVGLALDWWSQRRPF
jgi:3-phosphoshikimate 1-carboxyvinyltransferase